MSWFRIEPEVAGGLGPNTELDRSTHPPPVENLHYVFDGWLGDDLLESFPAFIVTADAALRLEAADLSGFRLGDVEVGTSETFDEVGTNRELPEFRRLEVTARARDADFGLDDDNVLVISDAALDVLRQGRLEHADIEAA
jgi:hypothetical protein